MKKFLVSVRVGEQCIYYVGIYRSTFEAISDALFRCSSVPDRMSVRAMEVPS